MTYEGVTRSAYDMIHVTDAWVGVDVTPRRPELC
jgi:hypothetical protein